MTVGARTLQQCCGFHRLENARAWTKTIEYSVEYMAWRDDMKILLQSILTPDTRLSGSGLFDLKTQQHTFNLVRTPSREA